MGKRKSKAPKEYTRPTKPINANASQEFGLRVAEFFHHDIKTVLQPDDTEASGSLFIQPQFKMNRNEIQAKIQPNTIAVRNRAIAHAKLVKEQGTQLRKLEMAQWPPVKPIVFKPFPFPKQLKARQPISGFIKLPVEIKEMIFVYFFSNRSSRKQNLFDALQGYGDPALYAIAKRVWCQESDFHFSLDRTKMNESLDGLDQEHMNYLRRATVVISTTVTPTSTITPSIFRAHNISTLTLNVYSALGFRKAIDRIIPHFRQLRTIKARVYRTRGDSVPAYLGAKDDLDRVLDWKGKLVNEEQDGVFLWEWDISGHEDRSKVFQPRRLKLHIKFTS